MMFHELDVTIDRSVKPLLSSRNHLFKMYKMFCPRLQLLTATGFHITLTVAALLVFVVLSGCTTATGRPLSPVSFGPTAKANYDRGMSDLERKSLDRARRYFKHVRREFPYSRYASLAELRLADCDFAEEAWAEAAAAYRRFVKLHRTHPNVDHAAFRRGLSFYKMIPSDWFLVPPSYERDMSATRDALRELRSFLRQYPESEYTPEATKLVGDCFDRLARHEMYVARFYLRRDQHKAAIGRTKIVEEQYTDSSLVPEAMFVRGETYISMENLDSARRTFLDLAERYPESPEALRAQDYLRHLGMDSQAADDDNGDEGLDDENPEGDAP